MKNKTQRCCTALEEAPVRSPRTASNCARPQRAARSIARLCNAHDAFACRFPRARLRPASAAADAPCSASILPTPPASQFARRFAHSRRDFTVSSRTAHLPKLRFLPAGGSLESLRALSVCGQERSSTQ